MFKSPSAAYASDHAHSLPVYGGVPLVFLPAHLPIFQLPR